MRVLVLDNNHALMHMLPNGFVQAGHKVKLVSKFDSSSLSSLLKSYVPHLIVTQGWGQVTEGIFPDIIAKCVSQTGIPHVYWSVEDPRYTDTFVLPLVKRLKPDVIFTICKSEVKTFRKAGFNSKTLDFAFEPTIHFRTTPSDIYKCDIALIANAYSWDFQYHDYNERLNFLDILLSPLILNNIRVDIWGRGWDAMNKALKADIPNEWLRGTIDYAETNKVYNSAKIIIGLQSYANQLTHRTLEIMGSGGFLLTNDTPEIRKWGTPDHDLVVTSSHEQTLDVVNHYLKHEEQREAISRQGMQTVSKHTYKQRAEYIIHTVNNLGLLKKRKLWIKTSRKR